MKTKFLFGILFAALLVSCAATKNETTVAPYKGQATGTSALVYALPQTRLYFDVELVKTTIKKGPYAAFANRMLGLQNVPMKDSELWQIAHVRINDRTEADNRHLYVLSYIDYPQNLDRLIRFTREGLIMDVTADHVLRSSYSLGGNEDVQFLNTAIQGMTTEKVDTFYKTILTDTAFVRIPVLQRKVSGKTAEEQAREAAEQIFNIRQIRLDVLSGNTDYQPEGAALKLILESLATQEEQLMSLFNGAKIESRYMYTFSDLPDKPSMSSVLFYFSDRAGIVNRNTAGAKEIAYQTGSVSAPPSIHTTQSAKNMVYYRIPQIVEVSVNVNKELVVSRQKTIYQLGNIVSFPLIDPK